MSKTSKIALVTRLSDAAEDTWLALLRAALPQEDIQSLRHLPAQEAASVEIAIVANPDPAALQTLPNLVWVQSLWAGVERLVAELPQFTPPIVRLIDPQLARNMSEAALAWTYYLFRDMPAYAAHQRARDWVQEPYRSAREVSVGILGLGALGAASARRLQEQDFNVLGWSRSQKSLEGITCLSGEDGFDTLLSRSDIVICLLPLTSTTTGLLNAAAFGRMKQSAALINFARGPIVDTAALCAALDAQQIKHAVLDVFDQEPLPAASPLWTQAGITVLPHISGPTDPRTGAQVAADNIRKYRETGTIAQSVDLTVGY
ncbi:Glyoxylate/hydroxypyruvate reductase A [Aquimixticola soesokkakensis]|uniref:Glyoxylate/hydroxypyruvate reductase A n=1 Tax=Aquimixticola soesokkakensis TaxID=1519096 RepID=A0A1Y5RZY0_9RHOB|nr:glyoxylate/hydroxypyruvate reductase A [Aquimixticola soesokkakensis]SLN26812.1 Glyoxylate/hydroxypyruvate reductase A [Aquimixticola soesokkakensis]